MFFCSIQVQINAEFDHIIFQEQIQAFHYIFCVLIPEV